MVLRVLEQGWSIKAAAAAAETSEKTCGKWVARYRAGRECGLLDHSSAPHVVANRTDERRIEAIAALRRLRFTGPELAELLGMPVSTVSGILTRIGLGRLGRLGLEPAERYERERPGELIHVDVKKLGRIQGGAGKRVRDGRRQHYNRTFTDRDGKRRHTVGWDFVHVAIDDATRLAYAEVLADEKASTAIGFLGRAIAFFRSHGITVERVNDRQRVALPIGDPRARLPRPGDPTPTHPRLPPADERQGRETDPHDARRLGLRRDLRLKPRTHRSP
jgi:hypothetical protein